MRSHNISPYKLLIIIIITVNNIAIFINFMRSSFKSLICEGVALKVLFALLTACPSNCNSCSYNYATEKTECGRCEDGYGVVEHNKTCAGDRT